MSSDIRRRNDSQIEMAIADYFRCVNITDQVVESTRFMCMLQQGQLVGGEFRLSIIKKLEVRILIFLCFIIFFPNMMKVNC